MRKEIDTIDEEDTMPDRINLNYKDILDYELSSFVYSDTLKFFEILKIDSSFLKLDSNYWADDAYKNGLEVFNEIAVVNDAAERMVKMVQDYQGNYIVLLFKDLKIL